jgi:hypothetical protein
MSSNNNFSSLWGKLLSYVTLKGRRRRKYFKENIEAIAHHEAGHAVACFINNIPIEYVTINLPDYSPELGSCEISKEWRQSYLDAIKNKKVKHEIVELRGFAFSVEKYSGGIAEEKFRNYPNDAGCRTDRLIVETGAKLCYGKNYLKALSNYYNTAQSLMDDPIIWRAVQAVTQELLKKRTLSQSELREICDKILEKL